MKNQFAKKVITAALAASLAFTSAAAFVPAATVNAADTTTATTATAVKLAKVTNVKYELLVAEGQDCIRFTWDKVEGANHYTWRYNTKYDNKKPTDNKYIEEEGDSDDNSLIIPVGKDYNDVWFQVAAMKDSTKGAYSDAVWASQSTVSGNLEVAKAEGFDALTKKAESLAKKYKKQGYANVTYCMYDIYNNGSDLMFFSLNGNRSGVSVYVYDYVKGKVVRAKKELGGVTQVTTKNGKIFFRQSNSAFDGQIVSYKLDTHTNKLKLVDKVKYNYGTDTVKAKFTKNGKKISKKAFEKYQKKVLKYSEVEYYSNEL